MASPFIQSVKTDVSIQNGTQMDAMDFLSKNKEWLFSGAGFIFLGWIFHLIKKFLPKNKEEGIAKRPENASLPAFELDGSKVKIVRTPIVGGVPHGLVKATGGSSFEMLDCSITAIGHNVEFSSSDRRLVNYTNSALQEMASALADELRGFQAQIDSKHDEYFNVDDGAYSISCRDNTEYFNCFFRDRALSILTEMLARLDPIARSSLPAPMRWGIDAARTGKLCGPYPVQGLAEFLDYCAISLDSP
jgi:hypothetical protein